MSAPDLHNDILACYKGCMWMGYIIGIEEANEGASDGQRGIVEEVTNGTLLNAPIVSLNDVYEAATRQFNISG